MGRLAEIHARHATWPALPDFREHATGDLEWALREIERLQAENAELRESLQWCRNITHMQEASPGTVKAAGLRVAEIVSAALAPKENRDA